jgi:hypothetical protein
LCFLCSRVAGSTADLFKIAWTDRWFVRSPPSRHSYVLQWSALGASKEVVNVLGERDGPRTAAHQPATSLHATLLRWLAAVRGPSFFPRASDDLSVPARRSIMHVLSSQLTTWQSDARFLLVHDHDLTHMCSRKATPLLCLRHIFEQCLSNTPSSLSPWGDD